MSGADALPARLAAVRQRIAAAAARAGRDPASVTLLGVGKRMPAERVALAARCGLEDLAENYVQEARAKIPRVLEALAASGHRPPRWHFVGQLQRNKAREVVGLFDVVQTVDRESLGRELDRRAAAAGRRLEVLLQVNVSREPQKGGVAPEAAAELLAASAAWSQLRVTGLMAIPAATRDPEASRPAFAALRELAGSLRSAEGGAGLRVLSMGMSADFEVAVEEGATLVRVGTAIFGPRPAAVAQG